jgi:hypothetical protein
MDTNLNFLEAKTRDPTNMPEVMRWLRRNGPIPCSEA